MRKQDKDIIRSAEESVFARFRDGGHDSSLVYHRYDRTRRLARACREIAKGCGLDDDQARVALLAAWFHDAGYTAGRHSNGVESAAMARRFLEEKGEPPELTDAVEACMRAARSGMLETAAQEVLHDALLVPTAEKDYLRELRLLRLESVERGAAPVSDVEWTESCIHYVEQHPFRTRYAQLEYNRGRAANLVRLHELLREERERATKERARAEKADDHLGKTIDEMYEDLTRNQLRLLNVADRRTATMIHVNAIMISLIVALLLRHVDSHPHLLVPTLILLGVNLIAVLISIVSMRAPTTLKGVLRGVDDTSTAEHQDNPFFLATAFTMGRDQYYDRMQKLARDPGTLRTFMLDATYFGRCHLYWRARMLRVTYDVFLVGLFVAVSAFAVAMLYK